MVFDQYFYHPDLFQPMVTLSAEESEHCCRALRHRAGDEVLLTDGQGREATAVLVTASPKACVLEIEAVRENVGVRERRLHIAIAPTKNADRIEWLVEKAVEIGIDEITPLITHNTERTRLNHDRLEKIAISAMKQSLHTHLPVIHAETSYDDFIKQTPAAVKMICHGHYDNPLTISQACPPAHDAVVVIGPEGDFTPEEIAQADQSGFLPVTLGDSRLRTETAALMVVCAINLINQTQPSKQ